MSTPEPRRRLDAETRRRAILEVAARAFGAAPYEEVSMASVAAEAGVSEALVFRYFESKADLYAALVRLAVADLARRQDAADAALPAGVPVRDRVRAALEVYLDHVAGHPRGWAAPLVVAGNDTPSALAVRRAARQAQGDRLRALLGVSGWLRHEYAVWGYLGFLDGACLAWVERGCPADERDSLVSAALGALEGALGDWAG